MDTIITWDTPALVIKRRDKEIRDIVKGKKPKRRKKNGKRKSNN